MPLLQINTNALIDDSKSLTSDASKLVASMLGKPESYVMIVLNAVTEMSFAGSDEACAHLKLKSLGIDESATAEYTKQLCEFIEAQLGISPGRVYIEFDGPARHMWGWDSRTF